MEPGDDAAILGLLQTDLDRGYVLLWLKYYHVLYKYVFGKSRDLHNTDDIMQDTALRIYNALGGYSSEQFARLSEHLRPWLYKVASSAYLTFIEKEKRFSAVSLESESEEIDSAADQPELILEQSETRDKLTALIAALPEKYREVIYLHYFEGFKLFEVADILQEPPGTVRQRERRALALLQQAMRKQQEEGW